LNIHFKHRHPDPFKLVQFIQEKEVEIERRHAQLQTGAPPLRKRKPVYVLIDVALMRLRNTYFGVGSPGVTRVVAYMDAVAHQLYDVEHQVDLRQ
jgi:hypothetical protein